MKIQNLNILSRTKTLVTNLRKVFNNKISLKTLVKDSFCKHEKEAGKQVRHQGDNFTHTPGFITKEEDFAGIKVRNMVFSEKDQAKMDKMSLDEMINYKAELIKNGLYKYKSK